MDAAYASVFASSKIATPVMLRDVQVSRYRVHFNPPPPVFDFQIRAVMEVEKGFARHLYDKMCCTKCNSEDICRKYSCGCAFCPKEYTENFDWVPARIMKCPHGFLCPLSHDLGVTGFDWNYNAGHEMAPFISLIGNYSQRRAELRGSKLAIFNYLLPIIAEKSAFIATRLPRGFLPTWNLLNRDTYGEHSFPDGSIGAVYEKGRGKLTKDACASAICDYIYTFFVELKTNLHSLAEVRLLLQEAISSVFVASPKLEVIAAKRVLTEVDGRAKYTWKVNPKARIFQMQNGITYGISRMFISPFTQNGGSGNYPYCQPSALGMNFTGDAAASFFSELYGIDPCRLVDTTEEDLRNIEREILSTRTVWESDAKVFDLSLLAPIIMHCLMAVFERYDTKINDEDDTESEDLKYMFRLVCARLVEVAAVKVTTRLDGKGFHSLIGTMASGSYETSYLNTICNLFHHFLVYVMYWFEFEERTIDESIDIVSQHFMEGTIRLKLFGDDVLANHETSVYPKWSSEFYRSTIFDYCNITVPQDDYVQSTKIFITNESLGPMREQNVPTFLKFQLMCVGGKICFVRHSSLSIPKMFSSSDKEVTMMTLYQRIICLMWTAGANYQTYYACRRALKSLGETVTGEKADFSKMLDRIGLSQDIFDRSPPTYEEIINFHGCPPINYQPRRIRTIIPWPMIVKFPKLKPYNFTNLGKINEELCDKTRERQEEQFLKLRIYHAQQENARRTQGLRHLRILPVAVTEITP
jgi:hypothetical protein